NDQELDGLVMSHYENEAQTLTTGTEANLLKFKEIIGWMNEEEEERWSEIKRTFKRNLLFQGADEADPMSRILVTLSTFYEGLDSIKAVLESGISRMDKPKGRAAEPPETRVAFSEETMRGMKDLLSAMKSALAMGMEERAKEAPEAAISLAPDTMKQIDRLVGVMKTALGKALKQSAPAPALSIPEKMEVVAEVPDVIRLVLEKQFDVMDSWMKPALHETVRQTDTIEKLMREMEAMKASYKGVIREKGNFDEAIVYYTCASGDEGTTLQLAVDEGDEKAARSKLNAALYAQRARAVKDMLAMTKCMVS
ncbi:MAG: hypothetical protein GY859_19550, partial [Desulfobacterales bacterium]|nr:hypothetical protein [Desulfobacterales bacterium]